MTDSLQQPPINPAHFRRFWGIVTFAGMLGMTYYNCVGGAPQTKFLTELKATPFHFGLISSLSSIALVFQIVSAIWTNHLQRRKPVWMAICILHRLLFIGVLVAPMLFINPTARIWWIIGVLSLNNALAHLGTPMWFSWMSDLIPHESLNFHWAIRQRFISTCSTIVQFIVALVFNYFEHKGEILLGFAVVASAGMVLGVIDICLFALIPEPRHELTPEVSVWDSFVEPLRNAEFRPYLLFQTYWNFALYTSAPFFAVYLIQEMKLSTLTVQLTFITASVGVAMASSVWGILCDIYGQRPALRIVSATKPIVPLAYIVIPPSAAVAVPLLALLAFFDGMSNSGLQIATQGVLLKNTPRRNRAMYIAATSFLSVGIAGGLAPLISGSLIEPLTRVFSVHMGIYHFTGYHLVFFVGLLLRAGAFPLTRRLREPESQPTREVISHLRRVDSLRVVREAGRLRQHRSEDQRVRAALLLGRRENPMAVHELIRALDDPYPRVRAAAADSLGRIGNPEAVPHLVQALDDEEVAVQFRAVRALGRIGGEQALHVLTDRLHNLRDNARGEASRAIARLRKSTAASEEIPLLR